MAKDLGEALTNIEKKLGGTEKPELRDLGEHLDYIESLIGGGGDIELKTINGQSLKGEGNIAITTYQAFPSAWPVDSTHTAKQFCDAIDADEAAVIGMGYFGGAKWSDKPAGLSNGDVVVEILEGPNHTKAIHLIMTSSSVYPYRWEYTYWSHGSTSPWRGVQPELPDRTGHAGQFLKVNANADGFEYGSTDSGGKLYLHTFEVLNGDTPIGLGQLYSTSSVAVTKNTLAKYPVFYGYISTSGTKDTGYVYINDDGQIVLQKTGGNVTLNNGFIGTDTITEL